MKKAMILFLICFTHLIYGQQRDKSMIGRWIGTDEKNQLGGIEFLMDGTAKLLINNNEMLISEYKVDYSKEPIWVDLILKNNGQTRILHGLVMFIDTTTIKWEVFPMLNSNRPNKFTENSTVKSIILKKQ